MTKTRTDFFGKIEDKYNIALSKNRPIILRFDARNTTKNKNLNLLDESEGSFTYALKKTSEEISIKYKCLVYVACDEINIIIFNVKNFLEYFKSNYAQEITASISQEISFIFHKYYTKKFTIFAGRAFSLYKDNVNSYLIYRKHTSVSVLSIYYCKRYGNINFHKKSYNELHKLALEQVDGYKNRTIYQQEGICYYKGFEYTIEEILQSNLDDLNNKLNKIPIKDDDI